VTQTFVLVFIAGVHRGLQYCNSGTFHNRGDSLGFLSVVLFNTRSKNCVFQSDNAVSGGFKVLLCVRVAMSWMESASFAVEYYIVRVPVCIPVCGPFPHPLLPFSSSSLPGASDRFQAMALPLLRFRDNWDITM
jgi:hypothetical protein